jgi:hypothetical protein
MSTAKKPPRMALITNIWNFVTRFHPFDFMYQTKYVYSNINQSASIGSCILLAGLTAEARSAQREIFFHLPLRKRQMKRTQPLFFKFCMLLNRHYPKAVENDERSHLFLLSVLSTESKK